MRLAARDRARGRPRFPRTARAFRPRLSRREDALLKRPRRTSLLTWLPDDARLERDFLAGVMLALRSVVNIANAKMQTQFRRMKQSPVEINCEHVRFLRGWGGLVGIISLLTRLSSKGGRLGYVRRLDRKRSREPSATERLFASSRSFASWGETQVTEVMVRHKMQRSANPSTGDKGTANICD